MDVNFDFTSDTPGFWDNFWDGEAEKKKDLGVIHADPDAYSPTLKEYHRKLWSKRLPNGEMMELAAGVGSNYLTWKDFRFGSDSVLVSFRYLRYRDMLDKVAEAVGDYRAYVENYIHKMYTIGGMIIFPKRNRGMNQSRGCNPKICDRWDLTLECIRRHYNNESSPLQSVIEKD